MDAPTNGLKRRGVWAAGLLSIGLMIGRALAESTLTISAIHCIIATIVLTLIASCCKGIAWRCAISLAAITLGTGWYLLRVNELPHDALSRQLRDQPALITLEGIVTQSPRTTTERAGRLGRFFPASPMWSFPLDAHELDDDQSVTGHIWVRGSGPAPSVRAGETVRLMGFASAIDSSRNPGELDRRPWLWSRGYAGRIDVEAASMVEPIEPARAFTAWRYQSLESLRSRAARWLETEDPATSQDVVTARALLRALLLGHDEREIGELRDAFMRLGIAHVLSISGMNLALLAATVLLAVRAIGARPRVEAFITALVVLVYLAIIPVRAPVLRAGLMVWALLAAESTGRRYDRINILGWVAFLTLLWQPLELWSAGFQLSFGVVWGLLVLTEPMRDRLFGPRPERDTYGLLRACMERMKEGTAAALVAWIISAPVIIYHVGVFSPWGAVATLILAPIIGIMMGLGYLTLVIGMILPPIAHWVEPVLSSIARFMAIVVRTMDAAPGSVVHLPSVSAAWTILASTTLIWWMLRRRDPWGIPISTPLTRTLGEAWERRARWAFTLLTIAWFIAVLFAPKLDRNLQWQIDTFDVGDGTCHLLRSRDLITGETSAILWDCGSMRLSIGERTIPAAIRAVGAWRIPTVILSHPNTDHYAAIIDLIGPLGIREVILGEAWDRALTDNPLGPAAYTLEELKRRNIIIRTVRAGDTTNLAGFRLRFISPPTDLWSERGWSDNDASLVARLEPVHEHPNSRTILFTGDIATAAAAHLMQQSSDLRADLVEMPHHGSWNAAAAELIITTDPSHIVQSTGPRRLNDVRWSRALQNRDHTVTARDGAVTHRAHRDGAIQSSTIR